MSHVKPSGPLEATVPSVSSPTNAQTVKRNMSMPRSDLRSLRFSADAKAVSAVVIAILEGPPQSVVMTSSTCLCSLSGASTRHAA